MNKLFFVLGAIALLGSTAFLLVHQKKLGANITSDVQSKFEDWKAKYGKKYSDPDVEHYRIMVYSKNLETIQSHSNPEWTLAENQFMDLTAAEFRAFYLGLKPKHSVSKAPVHDDEDVSAAPSSVDWRTNSKVVQPIEDQGQCGSCWSFSTAEGVEGAFGVYNAWGSQGPVQLSEQQLVDCSTSYGNQGCNGGLMTDGFQYVKAKGLQTVNQYPYKARDQSCKATSGGNYFIKGFTNVANSVSALQTAVAQQPISVAVDAETWQFYSTGTLSCSGQVQLDHGVLAVGYSANDYWIVKNSWGTSWGLKGYIQVNWTKNCGISQMASYPTGPYTQ